MSKITQSGAIVMLSLIIIVAYFLFVQQDLVSSTQVARYKCLEGQNTGPSLCISCIQRSHLGIANQSSIFIKDSVNKFQVMTVPREGFLSCEQLLQLVQFGDKVENIKLQQFESIKQIIEILGIQMTDQPVNKFQADNQLESIAIFQLKQQIYAQNTLFTFASLESQILSKYYGKILAQCSFVLSIFFLIFFKVQQGDFKAGFIAILSIDALIFIETSFETQPNLVKYSLALITGFYFSKALISRLLTALVIFSVLGFGLFLQQRLMECLISVFIVYVVMGIGKKNFGSIGTLGVFCLAGLAICEGFRQHHHWMSLALRQVIQFTILTLSSLLMELVSNVSPDQNYNKLPTTSNANAPVSTGVSLPGFQDQISDEEDEQN